MNCDYPQEPMAYIARFPCGCIGAALVDDNSIPGNPRRVAKFITAEVKAGMGIERVTCEFVRQSKDWAWNCTHGNNPKDSSRPKQESLLCLSTPKAIGKV